MATIYQERMESDIDYPGIIERVGRNNQGKVARIRDKLRERDIRTYGSLIEAANEQARVEGSGAVVRKKVEKYLGDIEGIGARSVEIVLRELNRLELVW
jgi:hypothetical protein